MTDAGPSATVKAKEATGKSVKAGTELSADGKKRFEVKKVGVSTGKMVGQKADCIQWNAVALWAWDIVVDNCAICRNHIMDLCTSDTSSCETAFTDRYRRHRMSSKPSISYK